MGEIEESKSLYVLLTNQEIREFINSKTEQLLGLDLTNLDEVIELYQKHNQFKDLINILLTEKGKSFWNNHWSANNNLGELAEKYQKHPYACKAMIKAKPSILREHLDNYIDLYERYSKLITMYQLQDIGVYDTDTDDGKSHESEDRVPSSLGRHIALSSNEGLPSAEDLIEKFGNNRVMLYASSSETDESSEEESDEDDYEESSAESSEDNLEGDESEESDDRSSTNTVVSQKSHMSNLDDSDSKYEESEEVCSSDAQVDNNFASGYALDSDNETSIIGESTGS